MVACLDDAIGQVDVSDVSISSGIADEDSRIVMAVQFGGPFARLFDTDTGAEDLQMAKVEFFLECIAIRVGRYLDLGDVPFGDTVFIDRSRVGVRKGCARVRVQSGGFSGSGRHRVGSRCETKRKGNLTGGRLQLGRDLFLGG